MTPPTEDWDALFLRLSQAMDLPAIKVVSGGQTGADQGGLHAAAMLGLPTGGWAPKGWKTETGPAPWLADFGLREHPSADYAARTRENARDADATLLVGDVTSPGSRLTLQECDRPAKRPCYIFPWRAGQVHFDHDDVARLVTSLRRDVPQVLNVAGNRESGNPGIEAATIWLLALALAGM